MTGLVLLHGWGFGPDAWTQWANAFQGRPLVLLDAGYFGPEHLDLPPNPDGWVGVGHSLGFARLLAMNVPWRGLLGLGSFLRFCSASENGAGTPAATLDAMSARLDIDPVDVLARFLRRSGLKGLRPAAPDADGLARLRRDLAALRGLDLPAPANVPPVLLLHAEDDRIAPLALAREAHVRLPGSRLHVFETGGHGLPFTRTAACLALAREFLDGAC